MSQEIRSGVWSADEAMTDYRAERFSDMLIERATWRDDAAVRMLGGRTIGAPGYIWFRFWLLETDHIVEKYFDAQGVAVGIFVPVITAMLFADRSLSAIDLNLGLWIAEDGKVTVLFEESFDAMVAHGDLTPHEAAQGEMLIRELTLGVAQHRFPPALIRNFELNVWSNRDDRNP